MISEYPAIRTVEAGIGIEDKYMFYFDSNSSNQIEITKESYKEFFKSRKTYIKYLYDKNSKKSPFTPALYREKVLNTKAHISSIQNMPANTSHTETTSATDTYASNAYADCAPAADAYADSAYASTIDARRHNTESQQSRPYHPCAAPTESAYAEDAYAEDAYAEDTYTHSMHATTTDTPSLNTKKLNPINEGKRNQRNNNAYAVDASAQTAYAKYADALSAYAQNTDAVSLDIGKHSPSSQNPEIPRNQGAPANTAYACNAYASNAYADNADAPLLDTKKLNTTGQQQKTSKIHDTSANTAYAKGADAHSTSASNPDANTAYVDNASALVTACEYNSKELKSLLDRIFGPLDFAAELSESKIKALLIIIEAINRSTNGRAVIKNKIFTTHSKYKISERIRQSTTLALEDDEIIKIEGGHRIECDNEDTKIGKEYSLTDKFYKRLKQIF
ncbi:MAG: hypothetical protein HQK50_18780 [Oligoflexia bacterium]|nr:hypothetical protein [Oligoflexia bacterium]